MRMRVIDFEYVSPLKCEAACHGLASAMEPEDDAILCLVNPDKLYVSVPHFQVAKQAIDQEHCVAQELQVIRRHTGGSVALNDRSQMLMHFIQPRSEITEPVVDLYPKFIEPVVLTCRELGMAAEFIPINEIFVSDRKIGSADSAQIGEAIVVACNLMFDVDLAALANCLNAPSDAFRDRLRTMLEGSTTSVLHELHMMPQRDEFKRLLVKECAECLGAETFRADPTKIEQAAIDEWAERLVEHEWTFGPDRTVAETDAAVTAEAVPVDVAHVTAGGLISVHLVERDGVIADLVLSGEFSCIPSEGLEALSQRMVGQHLNEAALAEEVAQTMEEIGMQMPGIAPADIAAAIMAAHKVLGMQADAAGLGRKR